MNLPDSAHNPYAAPASTVSDRLTELHHGPVIAFGRVAEAIRFESYGVLLSVAAVVIVGAINLSVRGRLIPEQWMSVNLTILAGGFGLAWLMALTGCIVCLEIPPRVGMRNLLLPAAMLLMGRAFLVVLWSAGVSTPLEIVASLACIPGATLLYLLGMIRLADHVGLYEHTTGFRRVLLAGAIGLLVLAVGVLLLAGRQLTWFLLTGCGTAAVFLALWYARTLFRFSAALLHHEHWKQSQDL